MLNKQNRNGINLVAYFLFADSCRKQMLLIALYTIVILIVISVLFRFFNKNIASPNKNVKTMIVLGSGTYPGEKEEHGLLCTAIHLFLVV